MKAEQVKQYPDRYFVDVLGEYNSIKPMNGLSWIDDIEAFNALMND